ncbi:piggyBac transposable element-derived protein 4-like [Aplysia californica]|uniref:PiggyBac transposable element-derived protein 4-like n=1 Tax=Aplysia californica TaxID=6500 RepID=A0ABM1VSV1_APLCA|nr:piggyBac transposable element-derived protein 4-like [Aplysia californica]
MGLNRRPAIRDYWSQAETEHCAWYSQMFPRKRFEAIYHTMLHCSENSSAEGKDKIEPFVNSVLESFRRAFYPGKYLALDEMVVGWTGRWKYKQYNPSKPHKYHVKVFGLVDSETGYVVNLLIYFGRETSYRVDLDHSNPQAVKVFETLLDPLGPGHHVYSDRFYTSLDLIRHLSNNRTNFTGTLNLNRRGFPTDLKTLRLQHTERSWYYAPEDEVLCVAWKDKKAKKPVVVVSTMCDTTVEERPTSRGRNASKPAPVHSYNARMNGCDKVDQNVGYYNLHTRKSLKWWKKIFHWLMELVQVNALVLYNQTHAKKSTLAAFKRVLVKELVALAAAHMPQGEVDKAPSNMPPTNSLIDRYTGTKHLIAYSQKDRNCEVCSKPKEGRKRTNFFCKGCAHHPHLHPKGCFELYHTPESQRRV